MNNRNKCLLFITTILLVFASLGHAAPQCKIFKFYNNTDVILYLHTGTTDNICSISRKVIFPRSEITLAIQVNKQADNKQSDVFLNLEALRKQKFEIFLGLSANKRKRIVNEELIGETSAYSWSNNNGQLFFCNTYQFTKHNNSCRF